MGDGHVPQKRVDLLSSLPHEIALNILQRAGFSVLDAFLIGDSSRVWTRYLEVEFVCDISWLFPSWDENDEEKERARRRLFKTLKTVLLGLEAEYIKKFTLKVGGLLNDLETNDEIDETFCFLSTKKVEEVTIEIDYPFKLPSSLFSCSELTHLKVSTCEIPELPVFNTNGLKCLIDLTLQYDGKDGRLLHRLISDCPALKCLSLCLKRLNDLQEINAPCLEAFELICNRSAISSINSEYVSRVSLFLDDIFDLPGQFAGIRNPVGFFGSMSARLEVLRLDGYFLRALNYGPVQQILSNADVFRRVRISSISFHCLSDVSAVFFLVSRCRHLMKFKTTPDGCFISSEHQEHQDSMIERYLDTVDFEGIEAPELEEVKLFEYGGTRAERELLYVFLFKSPELKTIEFGCLEDIWEYVEDRWDLSQWDVYKNYVPQWDEVVDNGDESEEVDEVKTKRRYVQMELTRGGYS